MRFRFDSGRCSVASDDASFKFVVTNTLPLKGGTIGLHVEWDTISAPVLVFCVSDPNELSCRLVVLWHICAAMPSCKGIGFQAVV